MADFTELALQKGVTHFIITMTFTPYVPATNLVPLVAGSKAGVQLVCNSYHSGFPQEGDEKFQISWHENIFSRFVLQMLAHGL